MTLNVMDNLNPTQRKRWLSYTDTAGKHWWI